MPDIALPKVRPNGWTIAAAMLPLLEPLAWWGVYSGAPRPLESIVLGWIQIGFLVRLVSATIGLYGLIVAARHFMGTQRSDSAGRWALVTLAASLSLLSVITLYPVAAQKDAQARVRDQLESIVLAIDRYEASTGESPRRLEELVPNYLASIPESNVLGTTWSLAHNDGPGDCCQVKAEHDLRGTLASAHCHGGSIVDRSAIRLSHGLKEFLNRRGRASSN